MGMKLRNGCTLKLTLTSQLTDVLNTCFWFYFPINGNAIPVRGSGSPWSCTMSRLPYCLENRLKDSSEVPALRTGRPLPPGKLIMLISVRGSEIQLQLEIRLTEKSNDIIGTRTRDTRVSSVVPRSTTPLRAPHSLAIEIKLNSVVLVRERTIAIEQQPIVGEVTVNFCG
jgi:hypothetical protein